ncbi:hypothetical protein [Streptomyces omiyaensis]|uniref:Secreted protein n=1 Tax=Streptomyces omiyaensis TaxID=68247 RepID=A0ABW7C5F1_9ACTN|nr:hypothetical protein [Streptomyces omiyaensis]GGY81764.1 hypothetical protein GCM10010363_73150 [Streptomyces omiyaensis]
MTLRSHAGMGLLMTALASAAMVAPAAAVEAPVMLPLQGLEPVLPMDAPTVATGVPVPVPGAPTGFQKGLGALPDVTLPSVPLTGTLPETVVDAPLPELLEGGEPGRALLSSPHSEMAAATPGATLGNPVEAPRGNGLAGLPDLAPPRLGLVAPTLSGALDSQLGLAPERG